MRRLLGLRVAQMMGRKLEEADWAEVYCTAKRIPDTGWSNLHIDVMHQNLGVEQKMLCYRSKPALDAAYGTTLMHPSATRSIRIDSTDADPNDVMRDVLEQYAAVIDLRREAVAAQNESGLDPDMRTGWLLWQESLRQFMYFEEEMLAPDPAEFFAEWRNRDSSGARKSSKNLWIYERDTGRKRYSVTTSAGIKIQPYFDVPPPSDPNVYLFTVIGEVVDTGEVRVWLTERTASALAAAAGSLDIESVTRFVIDYTGLVSQVQEDEGLVAPQAVEVRLNADAYELLATATDGINDEHMFATLLDAATR